MPIVLPMELDNLKSAGSSFVVNVTEERIAIISTQWKKRNATIQKLISTEEILFFFSHAFFLFSRDMSRKDGQRLRTQTTPPFLSDSRPYQ
mmetsp:Transcript_13045/g.17705  ORF Transcript_13045/g.17705 Transcript_13045/m.17705 type:complete len:91 (+) Transcript_13045:454-726(+)